MHLYWQHIPQFPGTAWSYNNCKPIIINIMMGQAVPEGKENNNTCPRVYTRRHISSYIKKITMFRNVVVHMNDME